MNDTLFGIHLGDAMATKWCELHDEEIHIADATSYLYSKVAKYRSSSVLSDDVPEEKMWKRWFGRRSFGVWEWGE